jgi:triosephosphate isomerase (TIM)
VSRAAARKPLVAGNWKMHNTHFEALALTQKLAFMLTGKDFDATDVAVLPPFTALRSVQTLIEGDKLRLVYGAQDISPHDDGAYTGDVSGRMLAKLGCGYVLAGHSERRRYHAEDDALVNAKVKAALRHGITPILCIGETLEQRQAGDYITHNLGQLEGGLAGVPAEQVAGLVIAYEPVWAIGTGLTPTSHDIAHMQSAIRALLPTRTRILYGGSVNPKNADAILNLPEVDGALVGGASLNADDFWAIAQSCPAG